MSLGTDAIMRDTRKTEMLKEEPRKEGNKRNKKGLIATRHTKQINAIKKRHIGFFVPGDVIKAEQMKEENMGKVCKP